MTSQQLAEKINDEFTQERMPTEGVNELAKLLDKHMLTPAEIEVVLRGIADLEARVSDECDTLIDSIREKFSVQRDSHSG